MNGSILILPLILAGAIGAGLGWMFGGAIWFWVLVAWILSAPLTLAWALLVTRRRTRKAAGRRDVAGLPTGHHPAGR